VLITSGSQQGLDYLGKLFLSPGDTALVEWPTYLGALQAFNAYEPNYDRLDVMSNREAGDYEDKARQKGGRVKFAYVCPDFANPTGITMSKAARGRLLDLAGNLDIVVIEDGAYQALRYDGTPVEPVLALDLACSGDIENTRTVYCGTFSKTLTPGLRVGWLVAARGVISKLVLMKQAADLHSPTINQMAIDRVARSSFAKQVEVNRTTYRGRRDRMLARLEEHMPAGTQWSRPEGGMFVWVTLPEAMDGVSLLADSIEKARVAFVPGAAFHADGTGRNTIRFSFSCASESMIDAGIERLCKLIDDRAG
jgi:DNA-binding transcriptional MocR family regulator